MEEIIIVEEWRNIRGYLNYQVSNMGIVKNTKTGRTMKLRVNQKGYLHLKLSLKGVKTYHDIHRLVGLEFIPNPMNKPTVDHIDSGAKLNNTIGNLRWATAEEQEANKPPQLNRSSRYKGVCWNKTSRKWRAQIQSNRIQSHLGCFTSEEAAGLAYNKAAIKLFGEFAWPNPIVHNQD